MDWISVKDKTPPEKSFVISYSEDSDDKSHEYIEKAFMLNGTWWSNEWDDVEEDYSRLFFVTHWMPLPKAP